MTRLRSPDMQTPATDPVPRCGRGTQPVRWLVTEDNACFLVVASSAMLTAAAAGVASAHIRGCMFAAPIMAGIARVGHAHLRFVGMEIVERLLPVCGYGPW